MYPGCCRERRAKQSASHESLAMVESSVGVSALTDNVKWCLALAQAGVDAVIVVVLGNDGNMWRSDLHYRHAVRKNPVKHGGE